jgi:hypothetical protein
VHFRSEKQRRAVFAQLGGCSSLGNRFSFSSGGVSTGSGVADAIVNLWPDGNSVNLKDGNVGNAIVRLWPGDNKVDNDLYTVVYPADAFSEQEVLAAREEFDFPMAWVVSREGGDIKMKLDPNLVKKYYGGVEL